MKVKSNITKFIQYLNEKNYSEANKYLQATLHEKIKERITQSLKGPLFNKTNK